MKGFACLPSSKSICPSTSPNHVSHVTPVRRDFETEKKAQRAHVGIPHADADETDKAGDFIDDFNGGSTLTQGNGH